VLIHVVNAGETLYQISANYNVPMSNIVATNELPNPNKLTIGQTLVIPTEDVVHIVKPGETLWMIAQTYGAQVQSIIQANPQLSNPNYIYPGLRLYIPAQRHQVQSGETLLEIAQNYGVPLKSLIETNNIQNPNLIYPGTILIIPHKRPIIDVNGYIYELGERAIPIVQEVGSQLTYLSPFAYRIKEDGSLEEIKDLPAIKTAYEENIVPMMSITNFTSTELGQNLAHEVLSNSEVVEQLITNILVIMKEKKYKGLNIDFENVLPEDRELYNQFLQKTVDRLHPEGYFVSTAVAPKISSYQTGLLYEAHDYPAHGRIVDFVILMTYEWGYRLGPPQAISPMNEIRRVLNYAVSVIPSNKIFLGFQIYARDWTLPHIQGQEAETFDNQEAMLRAVRYGATIQYDPVAESPYYRYIDEEGILHEVWFEDARSAQAKFDAVKDYGLAGISYWALGYPYPQNWALLEDNFTIRKLI